MAYDWYGSLSSFQADHLSLYGIAHGTPKKIDECLKERHGILCLLEQMKQEELH